MTTTATAVDTIASIGHREGAVLAEEEYRRMAALLAGLGPDDWPKPTDCPGWTVRDLAGHVVGAMRSAASIRESLRQQRETKRRVKADGGDEVDQLTALQVELTAELDADALVAECEALVEPAARGRRRTPAPMRRFVKFPVEIGTISEKWTLGYLVDVILTRDTWMHRIDLSRAVDASLELDASHDGRIVADIVAEWARRHGQPFDLTLTGPAGGRYTTAGAPSEQIELDTIEFCRIVSGRDQGSGVLSQEVPF